MGGPTYLYGSIIAFLSFFVSPKCIKCFASIQLPKWECRETLGIRYRDGVGWIFVATPQILCLRGPWSVEDVADMWQDMRAYYLKFLPSKWQDFVLVLCPTSHGKWKRMFMNHSVVSITIYLYFLSWGSWLSVVLYFTRVVMEFYSDPNT